MPWRRFSDLVRGATDLDEDDLDWLHLLLADWQLLADLSFADLVLWLPMRRAGERPDFVAAAQMRPTTGPTSTTTTSSARVALAGKRPASTPRSPRAGSAARATRAGGEGVPVREETIPVAPRRAGSIAVGRAAHQPGRRPRRPAGSS